MNIKRALWFLLVTMSIIASIVVFNRYQNLQAVIISGDKIILPKDDNIELSKLPPAKNPFCVSAIALAKFSNKAHFTIRAFKESEIGNFIGKISQERKVNPYEKYLDKNITSPLEQDLLKLSVLLLMMNCKPAKYYHYISKDGYLRAREIKTNVCEEFSFSRNNTVVDGDKTILMHVFTEKPGYNQSSAMGLPNSRIVYANIYRPLNNGWTLAYHYVGMLEKWEKQKYVVERYARNTIVKY